MGTIESIQPFLEPIRKSIRVDLPPDQAFELFTSGIATWWPSHVHSISQQRIRDVVFEGRVGGRIYEQRDDGETFDWGDVIAWEPPRRFVMHWYPGRTADTAQEVEIHFLAEDSGTRVELEHRNWQSLGDQAAEIRGQYDPGWDFVLVECFAEACGD